MGERVTMFLLPFVVLGLSRFGAEVSVRLLPMHIAWVPRCSSTMPRSKGRSSGCAGRSRRRATGCRSTRGHGHRRVAWPWGLPSRAAAVRLLRAQRLAGSAAHPGRDRRLRARQLVTSRKCSGEVSCRTFPRQIACASSIRARCLPFRTGSSSERTAIQSQSAPPGVITTFIMGLAWMWFYLRERSLAYVIASHLIVDIFNLSVAMFIGIRLRTV